MTPVLTGIPTQTQLIPVQEMNPAQIAAIRNSVINQVVALASRELGKPESDLVVRDIQPYTDLGWDYATDTVTAGTSESWEHDVTTTTVGYNSVTGSETMADQRYVAIFGVRDLRYGVGATGSATAQGGFCKPLQMASLIKFTIGGGISAIWDVESMSAYHFDQAAFSPAAVVIPQNTSLNISFYMKNKSMEDEAGLAGTIWLQLIGVTVEPRGKVISP